MPPWEFVFSTFDHHTQTLEEMMEILEAWGAT